MGYELRGRFFEACDCSVPCPCWFEQSPDDDECTGLIAWHVERGTINGFDVSGLTAVSMSQHRGHRAAPQHLHMALVIDERADDGQFVAMTEAFSGELGGPLGELARMVDGAQLVERAPVSFTTDGHSTQLRVGPRVLVESQLLVGSTGRVITINDGVLASLLDAGGESGKAARFQLQLPHVDAIDATERSTTSGRFDYRFED
ncbi:MAG TPA: DUF1326 domain-containing protein [Conexibacter sp.]|jgi:hypothetical protein|nr:DUF1326 domain-containing protein [Conexibacter sp.]